MTEREKIIDVLQGGIKYELWDYPDDNYVEVAFNYEATADTLISAGIGDVKEAEHCAEVAERALLLACTNLVKDEKDNMDIELLARVVYTKFLRKAEKELTEEKEAQERRLKEIKGGKCK